jgi:iron complex transport system permease protein
MATSSAGAGKLVGSAAPAGTEAASAGAHGHRVRARWRFRLVVVGLLALLVLTIGLAVTIGPTSISLARVWAIVAHHVVPGVFGDRHASPAHEEIVWDLRLPRVLLGGVVGAGLAVVGAALQALVRNPLADPYVFGITSGAAVGATAVIVFGVTLLGAFSLSVAAFIGAMVAFVLVLLLAHARGATSPARLILAGVAVAYTMSAISSAMLYFRASQEADAGAAQQVLFWLLGGLSAATWSDVVLPGAAVVGGTLVLILQARSLNALLVGDETAVTLGIDLGRFRKQLFTLTALMTGVMVAVSGGIGFVGLMLPHAVRMLVGPDHRRVLPVCVLLGAIFLIWADVLARTVAAPQEIPIGIITALFGAPLFAVILRSRRRAGGAQPR